MENKQISFSLLLVLLHNIIETYHLKFLKDALN